MEGSEVGPLQEATPFKVFGVLHRPCFVELPEQSSTPGLVLRTPSPDTLTLFREIPSVPVANFFPPWPL